VVLHVRPRLEAFPPAFLLRRLQRGQPPFEDGAARPAPLPVGERGSAGLLHCSGTAHPDGAQGRASMSMSGFHS
jgi:hypothetical protein